MKLLFYIVLGFVLNSCGDDSVYIKDISQEYECNVRSYGALGDGVADDTQAIKAAIYASTSTLVFPHGNYLITSTLVIDRDNITLKGEGKNTSAQIVCAGAFDAIQINGSRCTVDGLAVDGNKVSCNGIVLNGSQNEVQNCVIQNCGANGIVATYPGHNKNIRNCKIYTCKYSAIISEASDASISDCEIANNEGNQQIILAGSDNRMFNCHIWSGDQFVINPNTVGIEVRASGAQIQGCVLDRNNSFGVSINPNDNQTVESVIIMGNWFYENGGNIFYKPGVGGVIEIGNSFN